MIMFLEAAHVESATKLLTQWPFQPPPPPLFKFYIFLPLLS